MQSNNPVFRRSEEFNSANAYGNQTYAGSGAPTTGYGQPDDPARRAPAPARAPAPPDDDRLGRPEDRRSRWPS